LWSIATGPNTSKILVDKIFSTTGYSNYCIFNQSTSASSIIQIGLICFNALLPICLFSLASWNYNIIPQYNYTASLVVWAFAQCLIAVLFMEIKQFELDFLGEIRMRIWFLGAYGLIAYLVFVFPIILGIDYTSLLSRDDKSQKGNIKSKIKAKSEKVHGNLQKQNLDFVDIVRI
jgi:hypothetical protein